MNNTKNNGYNSQDNYTLHDYIVFIKLNFVLILIFGLIGLGLAIAYSIQAPNIYKSTTAIRISKPQGSILSGSLIPEFQDFGSDRFVANEIEILKSYKLRSIVAKALIDSMNSRGDKSKFSLVFDKSIGGNKELLPIHDIAENLENVISIEQKRGLDIVEITVESTSPFEAAILANSYAAAYSELNLQYNRQQFIMVKEFLANQKDEKLNELSGIENALRSYQEKKGIVELPEQAKVLIQTSSEFQAKMNAAKIDLAISEKTLNSYKDELKKRDPDVTNYIENMATQPYLKRLQEQIADLQTQRDRAMSSTLPNAQQIIREAESRIADLRGKLDNSLAIYRNTILASSPEEIKDLTKKAFEEEAKYQANLASYKKYNEIMDEYNRKMNELPTSSIDLARLQREQLSYEKLFIQLEERYQEAIINEQSIPSNVLIIDAGLVPDRHAKPNRIMLVAIGLIVGLGFGAGFALLKKMMDNTVNTPNDIQNKDINLLAWIPVIDELKAGKSEFESIVAKKPDSIASEAYRTLRTRIRFSRIAKESLKTILVSSPVAQEGKTTTSLNLATVLANANYKTVLVDLDLRRPRVHSLFNQQRFPGLTDYFLTLSVLEAIVRKSGIPNLDYITSGTIPPNPSEILGSAKLEEFIALLKNTYDYVIIDSAPIISVTDSEILSKIVDGTILVVSAGSTEQELMEKSVETLNNASNSFLGVVLNRFTYRNGYSSYYKQYYYYPSSQNGEKKRKNKERTKHDSMV